MGDGQASDLQQFSVKDKVAPTRKRENTKQMKLENSKKQKVKEPNQKHRGTRGEDQCVKEESTFSTWKETPSQDSLVIRSALTATPLRTSNHGEPAKAGGQVPRPRGGAGDGTKLAPPPGTLGEGGGTRGDTHQGEDVEKVKSKQKKSKGRKSEEKKPEGLEEECAWRRGRRTKASTPEKGCGDRRGAHGDAGHRKTRPGERRGGLGAREERAPNGDKKTGAENPEKEAQAVAEPATAGRQKRAGAPRAEVVLASTQVQDGDEEEGNDTWIEKIKKEENEKLGGDTQVGLVTRSNKSKSKAVVSRKDQKRKPDTAGGQGAGEAKAGRLRETELDSRSQPEHVEGHAAAKEEGVLTAGPPKKKTRRERKVKAEKSWCGVEQGRGREEEARESEGAGLAGGREDERGDAAKGRKEGDVARWRWWEEEKSQDGVKWRQLEHRGPYFAPSYEPLPEGVRFYYDGKPVKLSLAAEEVATFYGKMLDHEYTTKEVFQNNFFSDWRKEMTAEERKMIKHMDKCDFTEIHRHFVDKAAARKALPKEERQKLKEEAERLQQEFGYCILDGHREKIGNFKTEPPGLFRGRGDHPKMGMLKRRVMPEDVTINCSRDSKIPEPPAGHHWKEVRCDDTVTWLASWTDNVQNSIKYIMLNPSSKLKGEKDWQKYEVARRLKGVVGEIRSQYRADWKSREMKKRQRAVALYFIDKLALRAGNEKEEGESADTVGCCSLRVEHVRLHPEADGGQHVVELDFLGKDSVRYYNRVPVEKPVYRNLRLFMRNKDPADGLFDRLTTTSLNKHLQHLMDGLTAKVFRTYNASVTLQEQLRALTRAEDSVAAKVLSYNRANRAVAVLCNHQRATPKTFEKSMRNLQLKIEAKQQQVADAKEELRKARADHKSRGDSRSNSFLKRERLLERLEGQLVTLRTQATDKEESKQVALGTSKLNYLDPRISVAWCKRFGVPVEKIYNRAQREKFAWALDTASEDFEF